MGDDSRQWAPPVAPDGSAAYFFAINRNRKSVILNLKPGEIVSPPPLLGQHTEEVLGDLLGLTAAEIEGLRTEGVL